MEISGEIDQVKVSPRQQLKLNLSNNKNANNSQGLNNNMSKNGINITQEQLEAILGQINSGQLQLNNNNNNNNNLNNRRNKSYENDVDDIKLFRKPQVVVNNDDLDLNTSNNTNNNNNNAANTNRSKQVNETMNKTSSLIDKKKLKWQQDMGK
jgi:hypothetical protein